jgi:hypothetical protein
MPALTRTIGPLHFEDLDPKRFEDLIRQLAYDFRTWRKLEATGRAGGDDGFDARGFEIVSGYEPASREQSTDPPDDAEGDDAQADRLWLIQCKRERRIGPSKLLEYLQQYELQSGENLHGLVIAAPCEFSKESHDKFNDFCRQKGLLECYLWGKAALEDMLFLPKNDNLLFAYFGFSLAIRQRSRKTELRAMIATKRRLKSLAEAAGKTFTGRQLIIRNAAGTDCYPELPPLTGFSPKHWWLCEWDKITHAGLQLIFQSFYACVDDGEKWDAADLRGLHRDEFQFTKAWRHERDSRPLFEKADSEWRAINDEKKAWLHIKAVIPYDQILAIDDAGDQLFEGVTLYCAYDADRPFLRNSHAKVKPNSSHYRSIFVSVDDQRRVAVFSDDLRRKLEPEQAKCDGEESNG